MSDDFDLREYGHYVLDEHTQGRLSRADLIRQAAMAGVSLTVVGGLLAEGADAATIGPQAALAGRVARAGGTLRIAFDAATAQIEPSIVQSDSAGAALQQVLEPLVWANADLVPRPLLAQAWRPIGNAKTWRFDLRQNVRFHDGTQFTADDVVAWWNRLIASDSVSPAKSALSGVLSPGNIEKVDTYTVVFHLDRPVASFPLRVSNYVAESGIPPRGYVTGTFAQKPVGTGPFILKEFVPNQSITLAKNPNYWQPGLPLLDGISIRDLALPAQVLAMQANDLDMMPQAPLVASRALLSNPNFVFSYARSASYRAISLRVDKKPFKDKRVRQAVALCLARDKLVKGLLLGHGDIGNDHAFAPVYGVPVGVPQRKQDYRKAKQLLGAAGVPNGFNVTLTAQDDVEVPQYATLLQQMVKPVGIRMKLRILPGAQFYGTPGKSEPWLQEIMVGTPWNSRPTPTQLLLTAYLCTSPWNTAHWCNRRFTALAGQYDGELNQTTRLRLAGEIAQIQNDAVPAIFGYWLQLPRVRRGNVRGLPLTSTVHLDLRRVTLS